MKNLITLITCFTISVAADGKIGGVTYFDFISLDDSTAFNFQRQYFSYAVDMSDDIKFKIIKRKYEYKFTNGQWRRL